MTGPVPVQQMNELEAKFLLQQGGRRRKALRHILQALSWAGYLVRPQGVTAIADRYFDTADGDLRQAGWSLRVRNAGGSRELTLKQLTNPRGGMFTRRELQQTMVWISLKELRDGWRTLDRGPVIDTLRTTLPADAVLTKLFDISTRRQRYLLNHVENPRSKIELALDSTTVSSSQGNVVFTEFEAELKQGPEALISEIAHLLDEQPALLRARVSKYQRGLQAIGCPPTTRYPTNDVLLTPSSAWVDLGIKHLHTQIRWIRLHEPLAWEGVHSEGVHQMRVGIRRIRAALNAFDSVLSPQGGKALNAEVRWLGRQLGSVRDLDVHLSHLAGYSTYMSPDEAGLLAHYQKDLLKSRSRAHDALREALANDRFTRLQRDLQQFVERSDSGKQSFEFHSIESMAQEFVLPQLKKILRQGRAITRKSAAERLHRLRIEIKRLRYQLEFLREPYGDELKHSTRRLARLQNTLGDHQDACVARDHLRRYRINHELGKRQAKLFKRLGALEQENARENHQRFFKDWRKFEREAKTLKQLFA